MASKLWVHKPDTFFLEAAREISEKWNFFVNRSVPENFGRENFSGQVPTESLRSQDSENVVGPKSGHRQKMGIVTENQRCQGSKSLCQFSSDRFETNRAWGPNIRVYVLFVSKRSDENWLSDYDP